MQNENHQNINGLNERSEREEKKGNNRIYLLFGEVETADYSSFRIRLPFEMVMNGQ